LLVDIIEVQVLESSQSFLNAPFMPLYEYECLGCRERNEVIQKFSDAPLKVCEACGGELRKILSAPAIQFKGTGWYVTDYGKGGQSRSERDGKSDTKEEKKTTSKSEAKDSSSSSSAESTKTESSKK
jgi:putative FmdB family regulatory protein